jgi:hypothetical protein
MSANSEARTRYLITLGAAVLGAGLGYMISLRSGVNPSYVPLVEISANGTRIVIFESSEVSSLPEEDRKLINTYWGQSVSSRLYLEDIHSKIYLSNTIAFAEGLYQKIIYDRLARAASTGLRQHAQ